MRLSFKQLSTISAGLAVVLALAWVFTPALYLKLWSIEYTDEAGVVMRRGAALFFAFAVILYLIRNTGQGPERAAVSYGLIAGFVALAIQGSYEFVLGHAGPGALFAVAIEIMFALAYIGVVRRSRSAVV